jgi:hypothetical protein
MSAATAGSRDVVTDATPSGTSLTSRCMLWCAASSAIHTDCGLPGAIMGGRAAAPPAPAPGPRPAPPMPMPMPMPMPPPGPMPMPMPGAAGSVL